MECAPSAAGDVQAARHLLSAAEERLLRITPSVLYNKLQVVHTMSDRIAIFTIALFLALGLSACDLLDVENPNSLQEERLSTPTSADAMVGGIQATVTRGVSYIYAPYSTGTDELIWVGSRDAWLDLSRGFIGSSLNEFSDLAFTFVAEAEWTAREFIGRLEGFQEAGTLPDEQLLAEAYLYGAIIKTTVGDVFSNWAFSDKEEPGEPIGEANMVQLYDQALEYVNNGLALDTDLEAELSAMRARILFSRSAWAKVHPAGDVNTADPLVNNPDAAAAAQEALDLMDSDDFIYELPVAPDGGFNSYVAFQVNERNELLPDTTVYIAPSDDENSADAVILEDPIDEVTHPYLETVIDTKYRGDLDDFVSLTVVSAREMHLIIAENALANGDTGPGSTFRTHINTLRALDGLSDYTGQIPAQEILEASRQANLYLQGRRLTDMYRFGVSSPQWQPSSDAVRTPGTFIPLTNTEIRANPNL